MLLSVWSVEIPPALVSKRVNALIFGWVDCMKDMRIKLTIHGGELLYARAHTACAARTTGLITIDHLSDHNFRYEGRMLIHPNQIEPAHRIYTPSPEDVQWAAEIVTVFEEEGIAKRLAAINFKGEMVDTPVYDSARSVLTIMEEITAFDKKRKGS